MDRLKNIKLIIVIIIKKNKNYEYRKIMVRVLYIIKELIYLSQIWTLLNNALLHQKIEIVGYIINSLENSKL